MKTWTLLICSLLLFCVGMTLLQAIADVPEVVISAETIRDFGQMSPQNIEIVKDAKASNGLALRWTGGANNPPIANPIAWFKLEFKADADKYFIWIRGKSDGDTGTDAIWFQFDDQIGTDQHTADPNAPARGLGNWRDVFDAGVYKWASQDVPPPTVVSVKFKNAGIHKLLVQPRQVPHFIDQILLSKDQDQRPEEAPWKADPKKNPLPVKPGVKLATTWGKLKSGR